jgi:cystathionine beta-synthase
MPDTMEYHPIFSGASVSFAQVASDNIIGAIGNTPIVRLNRVVDSHKANFYAKCEFVNPGGSIKDRIGLFMIDAAERKGLLKPGGTIIEATSGNTGLGLAMVAAVRGYKCIFVMADKQSEEKRNALRATGAQVFVCPTDVAPEDPRSYYKVSARLAAETPNSYFTNQYENAANPEAHYRTTGPELWKQCGDELDYLVVSIGTGGTVTGIHRYFREIGAKTKIIGVDPVGSIYYELFHTGVMPPAHSYLTEGIGEDFMPGTMDISTMSDIVQIGDKETFIMARRLIREEGLLCGGSSGTAVAGAVKYVEQRMQWQGNRKPNVLVMLPDSWSRYLSKYLNDDWMRSKGML